MRKTILLVEDDEDILDILYILLTEEKYDVIRSKGDDAFQQALTYQPFLVLLDHSLKAVWGADICKALKADSGTKDIAVIMMSAAADLEPMAALAGADGMLKKPFDLDQLLQLIHQY